MGNRADTQHLAMPNQLAFGAQLGGIEEVGGGGIGDLAGGLSVEEDFLQEGSSGR